ncbi:aldo/keto reductase [Lacticaseibacillus pabuli]|uniref:Aldo/keto reductase n=1 Tax=Lacticaseibacillus pabuli TaxID=3025672 RepID=A0ABY7WVQ5_9LACO|nr:aldo/keto reductase [Lacticaseibacillus sp. KACC 23028]WDF83225.1 aldo/keto reductase [Lacticaseibacillus sp. KACC 23028]
MKYTSLGKTGMQVSRLVLGTMNFGTRTDEATADKIMDRALDLGINFFDTANVYGHDNPGRTEEIIGRWFAQGGNRRERVVLATKFYQHMHNEVDGPNDKPGVSAYKLYRSLDASLKRLQTDHVELYQMHHIDHNINWDEMFDAYQTVMNQGKVYYAGSSNFGARHLAFADAAAKNRHFTGLVTEQHLYNLLERLPELELLPTARDLGMGVIVWSPLNGGLLAPNALDATSGRRAERAKSLTEAQRQQIRDYEALCKELGETESNVALAWLLHNPAITAPIIGPRTVAQLEDAVRAVDISLDDATMKRLDEIFPGPGGSAPEAYAW